MLLAISDRDAARLMAAKFGVSIPTAKGWTLVVRRRWADRAKADLAAKGGVTLEETRARLRMVFSVAMGQELEPDDEEVDPEVERRGLEMLDAVLPPPFARKIMKALLGSRSDLKVAFWAAERLAQLGGLLTSKGPPEMVLDRWKPDPASGEAALGTFEREVLAKLRQVQAKVEADGIVAMLKSKPEQPTDEELDPRSTIKALRKRIAELEAQQAKA